MSVFESVERVLCVGAHPDDIEIGCIGTLKVLRRANPGADIRWLVLSSDEERSGEARDSAVRLFGSAGGLTVHDFRDGHLPYDDPASVKAALVAHGDEFAPDLVFAPRIADAHQDHRFVGELVWQVYRNAVILHYEIAKYEGDLGRLNAYVALTEDDVRGKVDHLLASFPSQAEKPWFDAMHFLGLMRLRGVEAKSDTGYAEAFEAPKLRLS